MAKRCRKCGVTKRLSDFHRHPQMADGHLNQCKECKRAAVAERYRDKVAGDPAWVQAERLRCRIKYHRLYASGRKFITLEAPEDVKKLARQILQRAVAEGRLQRSAKCEGCGCKRKTEGHHPDYTKPLDVRWLCRKCHAQVHVMGPNGELHPLL